MNPIREAMNNLSGHWYKGGLSDGNGNNCGLGHVLRVSGSTYDAARCIMNNVAYEQYPDRSNFDNLKGFASFNDHPDTTEEEVLAVMEKAAIKWDELEG